MTLSEYLREQQAICDAATEGPWETDDCEGCKSLRAQALIKDGGDGRFFTFDIGFTDGIVPEAQDLANAKHICNARTQMPKLLAAVKNAVRRVNDRIDMLRACGESGTATYLESVIRVLEAELCGEGGGG